MKMNSSEIDQDKLMRAIDKTWRNQRSTYHVTLGELIKALEKENDNKPVFFSNGDKVMDYVCSYRGFYEDLSIAREPSTTKNDFTPAGELLDYLKSILDTELEGWKGGEFLMDKDTPLWMAEEGECGPAIVDMYESDGDFILQVKDVD